MRAVKRAVTRKTQSGAIPQPAVGVSNEIDKTVLS